MRNFDGADELVAMLRRLLSSRGLELVQQKDLNALHSGSRTGRREGIRLPQAVTKYVAVMKALCEIQAEVKVAAECEQVRTELV